MEAGLTARPWRIRVTGIHMGFPVMLHRSTTQPSSRPLLALTALMAAFAMSPLVSPAPGQPLRRDRTYSNQSDLQREADFDRRAADWRNGAVVYQVIIDRFAPAADLEAKRSLYPEPKKLRGWDEVPTKGEFVEAAGVWSHEIDFWGGDIASLSAKLDYIKSLGVDVVYLNPIHQAYTNHKYDAQDYFEVSPEYGTRADVAALADSVHDRGMKLVLDGVFNHMGRTSPAFQSALTDPNSIWRDWFFIGPEYAHGYRAWYNVVNLPEVKLENPVVQARLYRDPDSVVQGYLREGVDGWRLDVAFDIGFAYLSDLTLSAHTAKPGSVVIGEIWNYPQEWTPALDGVMNMHWRELILRVVKGDIPGAQAGRMMQTLVDDMGLEPLLKSWLIMDNHDTPRLLTQVPEEEMARFAQALQFTLPGSPCVYYGSEVGMTGGGDPEQRGPMRWDLANAENPHYQWMTKLLKIRSESRALRIGDFALVDTQKALGFLRRTDRVADLVLVLANPTGEPVREIFPTRDGKLMDWAKLEDALSDATAQSHAGIIDITIPPRTVHIFRPRLPEGPEYSPFKRVQ